MRINKAKDSQWKEKKLMLLKVVFAACSHSLAAVRSQLKTKYICQACLCPSLSSLQAPPFVSLMLPPTKRYSSYITYSLTKRKAPAALSKQRYSPSGVKLQHSTSLSVYMYIPLLTDLYMLCSSALWDNHLQKSCWSSFCDY